MFLVAQENKRKGNKTAIGDVEKYLISVASTRNKNLINVHGTSEPKWKIAGVIRSGRGKPTPAARDLKKLLALNRN